MNDNSSSCESNDFPRQRTKSLGYEIGNQSTGKRSFILQQNNTHNNFRQRQISSGGGGYQQLKLRKANSFYTISETRLSAKKSSPSWMTKRKIPLIVVSSDDTSMNRIQKIRKHRSMPQLFHGGGRGQTSSSSEEDCLFNKEEKMRIKSTILDIPFYENNNNKIESIDQTPDSIYCSSTQEGEDENITASSSSSDTNLMEPNYTEDIDDDHQAMLVIAEKKIITPSYTVSRSIKPRIVFMDELNKWRENNTSSSSEQEGKNLTEKEVLISNQPKSISIDLPFSRSIAATEDYTSDEIYERLRPLSSISNYMQNNQSSSSDHWKRLSFNKKRKTKIIPPAIYGDSQDSRVEILMTPEPCEFKYDKESPSFPKRFSDDPVRRTMLSIKKKEETNFEKEKVKKPPSLKQQQKQLVGTLTDGWNRSPLTPKSSQFFTEMNPDNNLKDVLAAWEALNKEGEGNNQFATRRRSMTVGNMPRFEEIQEAEGKNKDIVRLDKSLGLDFNSTDEKMRKRSSTILKGKQWFFNRKRENEIKKDIKEFKPHVTKQTSEILPSSWVRQSLMENEIMINGLDDIVDTPIRIEPRHSFGQKQEARRTYFQNQAKEEQKRKVELENLDSLIAWSQISIDEKGVRESIFEENRKNKDLSALFGGGGGQASQDSFTTRNHQGGKLIRKTASDKSTLHQRFMGDNVGEAVMRTKPLENITRKNSMNPFKTQRQNKPPPIPKKPSISKLKKEYFENSYIPIVTNEMQEISHHHQSQRINSLVNESLSETPRSIASISPIDNKPVNDEQKDHELELDAFLIEVDKTFRTRDTIKNFHKINNNFQIPTSTPPNNQSFNETNHRQQININSKPNRRNSLSQIFKWKSIKADDQQNIQSKHHSNHYPNQFSQRNINSTMKLHQRSKSNLIQLFARHKNE